MQMKRKSLISSLVIFLGLISQLFISVPALAAVDYGEQLLTHSELQDEYGNAKDHFTLYDTMVAHYDFVIPDDVAIHNGDSMTISLPPELVISGSLGFAVTDDSGNIVGQATVDKESGKVVIVFTDYYETHPNDKKGSFNVYTQWNKENVTSNQDVEVNLGTGGSTIHIDEDPGVGSDEKLSKWGWVDDNDPTLIHWVVRVNFEGNEIQNAVYTDYIGANQLLVPGTANATLGYFDANNTFIWEDDLDSSKISEAADGLSFTVNYGTLEKSSVIYYDTKATDNGLSSQYENSGKLTGSNIEEVTISVYTPKTGGNGNGSGANQSVLLTKKDAATSQVLDGAMFKLLDANGNLIKENLITDANGQLKVEGLASGNYFFVETKAPAGYLLDNTPLSFEIVKNQETAVQVEMTNIKAFGQVILTKIDGKTGLELSGALFELQDQKGTSLQENLRTDKNGQIHITNLAPGEYQFIETQAPDGYQLDQKPVKFTIKKNDETIVYVSKENTLLPTVPTPSESSTTESTTSESASSESETTESSTSYSSTGASSVSDDSSSRSSSSSSFERNKTTHLPKTGEHLTKGLTILGGSLLLLTGIYLFKRP
ncbi:LPXTG-domain-containing protein cell wall anchor domain [Enterococcus phoeniculicola]|jgi:LPXTG-motif cell wall-anchored protein|uniref:LPXTG-domain-containing protein cell wall anchor domain n=1 Tax=Enterococcus phoeniculicola ATCC BAA-412 TaxID=1158610 RepID=R3TPU1_9ENTE|nr:SpaA isopeptide-forming pilin-related protein [Enterococcus phoeniculicola]EOL43103.1 LPXTG-domain-containing protein cell wall anchor domain [Enterococcus phoeniculicola ATCC BAA-412]EOT76539.1 hypothetical protein I589_01496 [Enterococcus phoeniculicola ATCC BAA-412]OJG72108.1 LPXTG-domain-containing protein cell wall anchor domain [Enterococcus phoeniculicola]